MPDFGLTEALAEALRGAKSAEVMRPAERQLAAQAAKTAPEAAAPAVPGAAPTAAAPPVARAPIAATPPDAVQAPPVNPSVLPPDVPPQQAADAATDPTAATPAPQADAQQAAAGSPPPVAPDDAQTPPPMPAAPPVADPSAVAPADRLPPPATPDAPAPTDVQLGAQRFIQANLSDFDGKLDLTHMPNVNTMQSPDGVKAGILQIADDNKAAIEAARGTAATHEQLLGMAQDLSIDPAVLQQSFDREFGTVADTAAGDQRRAIITAARIVEQNTVGSLYTIADRVANGTASADDLIQWHQYKQATLGWMTRLAGGGAESGRDLNVFGMPVDNTLPTQVRQHLAQVLQQNYPDEQSLAAAIRTAGTPSGIANILQGSAWVRAQGLAKSVLHRVFINGILSGPTFFKILWNNTVNLGTNAADVGAAAAYRGMANLAARIGRYPTPEEGAALEDTIANLHGTISGFMDGLRVAGHVMRTGKAMDEITRATEDVPSMAKTTNQFFPGLQGTLFGRVANVIDKAIDMPGRVVAATDDFTKTMGYRGYLTMMTMKEVRARIAAGSLQPGQEAAVVKQMMEHPTDEMEQAAEAWAHRQTFQTPWTPGGPGEAFQKFLTQVPALRFVFPFMRTATNIFKQSFVERTPFGLLSARLRAQIAAGGVEGDLAKSRIMTGTMLGTGLAWMAINDRITGGAPKDAKERLLWEADGHQPYSIRITNPITGKDTWRSYQWFEPMASIAGATADAVSVMRYIHGDADSDTMMPHDNMASDAAEHIIGAIIENVGNKTFMQGAAAFSEMYNDPKRAFGMWADQIGSSFVPFSGLTKEARNFQDPYLRQAYTLIDKIKDDLPTIMGVKGSETLSSRLDFFGEPRLREGGDAVMGPLSPMPGSPSKAGDPVMQEINSIADQTRTVPITMPSKQLAMLGNGKGLQDGQGMRLTPEEYNDYVRLSRNLPVFNHGTQTYKERLEQTFQSPAYQRMTPAERSDAIKYVTSQADKLGRAALWNESDEFRERMTAWTAEKNRLKYNQ